MSCASRREFLQRSATAAAAASLAPLATAGAGVADAAGTAAGTAAAAPARAAADDPAAIRAFEKRMLRARPLALGRVTVTGGPLRHAQDLTAAYLLSLDPDRMMAYYRRRAGLPQKAEPYGGWDGDAKNLTGHIAGHHLSAVSIFHAITGDPRFKARAAYLVREMAAVQAAQGDGYLSALANGREAWAQVKAGDIRSAAFDLNGLWSPWYTLHKTFAGLRDAYRLTGDREALAVEVRFAQWAETILAPLDDAQVARMLNTEHGGMNEVLADLYADTGDRRWLALSQRFEHAAFTDPLKRHQDNLSGKHGNCQIPKLIGSAARYGYTADPGDLVAASFFWDRVAQHHSYATGGHGLAEYFGQPDRLAARVDGRTAETCNCYNMAKLTRRLFGFRPDAAYADFLERTLFNHILASIDDADGRTSYMVPVGRGVEQEYQDMLENFTCCVGTGMESHGLHADGLYYESDDTVYVNLFVPSVARFTEHALQLEQVTRFPEGDATTIRVTAAGPRPLTIAVRRPAWAGDGFAVKVNGTAVAVPPLAAALDAAAGGRRDAPGNEAALASTYVRLTRTWRAGDTIELAIPKTLRLEPVPDDATVAAVMWGPLALAADHGPRREGRRGAGAPVPPPLLVAGARPVHEWIVPAGTREGDFVARGVGRRTADPAAREDVAFTPFHRTHRRRYSIYQDVLTEPQFGERVRAHSAEVERQRRLEAATVAYLVPGDIEAEATANYASDPADRRVERNGPRAFRAGPGWFEYGLMVEPTTEMALVVTYFNDLGLPPTAGDFEIRVDGTPVARFTPNPAATGFFDVRYAIPAALIGTKARVTVRFATTTPTGRIAPVYAVRIVRAAEAP